MKFVRFELEDGGKLAIAFQGSETVSLTVTVATATAVVHMTVYRPGAKLEEEFSVKGTIDTVAAAIEEATKKRKKGVDLPGKLPTPSAKPAAKSAK